MKHLNFKLQSLGDKYEFMRGPFEQPVTTSEQH